jgi:protein-tyrosine phosphatase
VKYGITFLVLAGVLTIAGLAADFWPIRILAWNAAVAFALLAAAYLGAGPRLLFKRPNGTRSLASWPLLWPYNLYIGRRPSVRDLRDAGAIEWRAVLDLAAEFAEVRPLREVGGYRSLPVLDATAMSFEELESAVHWLQNQVTAGPVLVHCALGHGRSATIAVAYLLAVGQVAELKEGLTLLRARRGGIGLHTSQLQLLARYAQTLAESRANGCVSADFAQTGN